MDKLPGSTGVSPGGGADGAFERFLTAAIATIITIMFSWRLLSDEEQAAMAQGNTPLTGASIGFQSSSDRNDVNTKRQQIPERPKNLQVNTGRINMKDNNEVIEKETTITATSQPVLNADLQSSPSDHADDSFNNNTSDDNLADETLTTWDDYRWEEDDDSTEVVHTRRSIKDFINRSNTSDTQSPADENAVTAETVSPQLSSPSLSFTQRFANFEYRDSGGDSGYIDLYPDVESDDSTSDSEHEYDIQVSDSDSSDEDRGGVYYGVTSLDTIMEEEAYSSESDEGSGKHSKHAHAQQHVNKNYEQPQTQYDKNENATSSFGVKTGNIQAEQSTVLKSGSTGENTDSHLSLDMFSKGVGEVNKSRNERYHGGQECEHTENDTILPREQMTIKSATILSASAKKDIYNPDSTFIKRENTEESDSSSEQSPFILHLSKLQSKMKPLTQNSEKPDEQNITEASEDSLPPSPIRTCALDNLGDEPFSDTESCSSESVITVLSVRSADGDQYRNFDIDDHGDEPLSTSVISIINNGQTPPGTRQSDQRSDIDRSSVQMKFGENITNIGETSDGQLILPLGNSNNVRQNTPYENGFSSRQINGSLNTDSSETGNSVGSSSTDSLISQENNHITQESFNATVNGFDTSRSPERSHENGELGISLSQNERLNRVKHSSSSSDSSDPPLREYDPRDDDLAEFHFHHTDSDEDSFYLIVGDDNNLRNFETFQNLNSVGLSPEYSDARTSTTVNESAKGFTFSRTEEISKQFRRRAFVTDRGCNTSDSDTRSDEPLSPITSEEEDNGSSENEIDSSDKVIIEFDLNKALRSDSNASQSTQPKVTTYDDAMTSGVDAKLGQTENERKLDLNKYIIQSDTCTELERNKSIDLKNVDSCQSIDKNSLKSGQSKNYIDSNSAESNSFTVKDINNSEYTGETFSELLDKIENLGQEAETIAKVSSPTLSAEKSKLPKIIGTDTLISGDTILKKQGEVPTKDSETNIKAINSTKRKIDKKLNSKIETNVDDLWSNESPSPKVTEKANSIETNVDDIIDNVAVIEQQTPKVNVKETQKPASHRETNVDDIFDYANVKTEHSTKSQKGTSKFETNVDDIFIEPVGTKILPKESEKLKANQTLPSNKETEFNGDELVNETVALQLCSPLESTPSESTTSPKKHVSFANDKNRLQSDRSGISEDIEFDNELLANDLKRQQIPVSTKVSDGTVSNELCSNKTLDRDSKQTDKCTTSSEYTNISKPNGLSSTDKEISGDLFSDRAHITESNDLIQYKGEASVTNNFENSYIGHSRQTIPQQLRHNPIHCSDVSNIRPQNNETSNNESLNIPENYSCDKTEKTETLPIRGIVQLSNDNEKAVKRNSNYTNIDNKTNVENSPAVVDYNANVFVPKTEDNSIDFGVKPSKLNISSVISDEKPDTDRPQTDSSKDGISCDDIKLKIVEQDENEIPVSDTSENAREYEDSKENLSSLETSSLISDSESLNSLEDSFNSLKQTYDGRRQRGHSESAIGRVVRTPVVVPSDLKRAKTFQGVKRKIQATRLKQYTSILQQPITPEKVHVSFSTQEKQVPLSRLRIAQSRKQFLSEENISGSFDDKFLHYRNVLVTSTPRKYLKRHERQLMDMQSTESLPTNMSAINASHCNFSSMDMLPNYSVYHPRHVEELFHKGYDSRDASYEHADYDKLHKDCIFSPKKREEIRYTTESLENMFEQLLRYGSVSSLAHETNLDDEHAEANDISEYVSFQYPLERAASMSALTGSSDGHRLPRKPGKGRFASRQVPKSKSLQTLETNIDDVFEDEIGGELKKTPSVHELRVSKSLSKLNVPDWFKKSSFSRSGSTQSLFTYAGRQSSTSTIGSSIYPPSLTTSPSPSITPGSNTVIIQKRVTPSSTSPATKLIRAPLPTTPEKAPIPPTTSFSLPSDKYRKKDKKELKPIAIVPFAKLREMFERGSSKGKHESKKASSPVKSPTSKENPHKVTFAPSTQSSIETVIDEPAYTPVQNHTTSSSPPPPPVPERKPILIERDRSFDNGQHNHNHVENTQQRRAQVHFSDEEENVSNSQEQNSKPVRKNPKPQSIKTSLPMPQFRFRRPMNVKPVVQPAVQSTQSKKGKECYFHDNFVNAALHALQYRAKIDGEHLFEFLQRRRYSSLLENGFAEQMDDLQDKEVRFNFPVIAVGKHSINGTPRDGNEELQVILTNTCLNNIHTGELNGFYRGPSIEEEIEGLLAMREHRAAMLAMEGNRSIPRFALSEDDPSSPESPSLTKEVTYNPDAFTDTNDNVFEKDDLEADYILITCDNPVCKRETNLKEAKKFFKTCHSCFSYYCSRSCRKEHWEAHKKVCVYSRINSACKHVIKAVNKDPHMQYQCSRLARRGYLSRGRGCVVFAFPDISSTEDFLFHGLECLWVPPVYVCLKELPDATMLGTKLELLTQTCLQYNPELKYVIHVAIVIPPKLPSRPVPRKRESIIQKSAKLRLSPAHMHPKPIDAPTDHPSTMILTAVPGNKHEYDQDGRKTRELCFINIQRKLRQRGVSLRHHYPNVYNKLIDYVSDAKHFSPLIIYPTDNRTGKRFMCVVMPESEPEIEWIKDPDLLQELDIFDDEGLDMSSLELPPPGVTDSFV